MFRSVARVPSIARKPLASQATKIKHATFNTSAARPHSNPVELERTYFELNNGTKIPALGYQAATHRDVKPKTWKTRIYGGYRHIDMHSGFHDKNYLENSLWSLAVQVGRDELFVTGKLESHMHHDPHISLLHHLRGLRTGYLDLWVMKWPITWANPKTKTAAVDWHDKNGNLIDYVYAWKQMEKQYEAGKVKALGIANFSKAEVERLLKHAKYPPQVHQMEITPYLQQKDFVKWNQSKGITVASFHIISSTNIDKGHLIREMHEDPVLVKMAEKYNLTVPQLIIGTLPPTQIDRLTTNEAPFFFFTPAWNISRGVVAIPPVEESQEWNSNLKADNIRLDESDMEEIAMLDKKQRLTFPSGHGYVPFADLEGNTAEELVPLLPPRPTPVPRTQRILELEAEKGISPEERFGTRSVLGYVLPWTRTLSEKHVAQKPREKLQKYRVPGDPEK
ncbi:hypothetical protein H072_1023 [Dactylellina haptotyla CBS 200.50]|uniref:NADP-dependent oxidoreductase domain-containing protein n=1 Tax=Dactylellina haptotyla (strain CBS 200.50) TaxID=1284197 RepID=S8AVF1_DACHA|nr:hypothetical protein H072_1023 [Dactylellina haptotyla CBS 200.50]